MLQHLFGVDFLLRPRSHEDPDYTPLCDIDQGISCSAAFNSSYGKGFGFVNKLVGGCCIMRRLVENFAQLSARKYLQTVVYFSLFLSFVEEDHWLNQPNVVYGLGFYSFLAFLSLFNIVFFTRILVWTIRDKTVQREDFYYLCFCSSTFP